MAIPKQLPKAKPPEPPVEQPAKPKETAQQVLSKIDWDSLVSKSPESYIDESIFNNARQYSYNDFLKVLLPDFDYKYKPHMAKSPIRNIEQTVIAIDVPTLMEAIQEQMRLLQISWGRDSDFILMGAEEYAMFAKSEYVHQFMSFTAKPRNRYGEIMGMPIRVCPHITGFCIVPKEERY